MERQHSKIKINNYSTNLQLFYAEIIKIRDFYLKLKTSSYLCMGI